MRPVPLIARTVAALAFVPALAPVFLSCSLSLEDPEVEARKKLAKLITPTWELLEGRWVGDSTYTLFDTRADRLPRGILVDVFPDSSWWVSDTLKAAFPGTVLSAPVRLSADTLYMAAGRGGSAPDTFLVRMRFLGNYLELFHAADQRSTHFHKLKPIDSLRRETLLDSGIWTRRAFRSSHAAETLDSLRRDFDYLLFSSDSLVRDTRRNGLSAVEAGPLARSGRRWAWSPAGGSRSLHVDLYHADSLRVWVLEGGRADSGYALYTRAQGRSPRDLDMTPYAGHLRADTVRTPFQSLENHYGRFYDLVLGKDHKVSTLTNMASMPRYTAWNIDSGFLWLDGGLAGRTRYAVTAVSGTTLRIACDSNADFSKPSTLALTVVDGSRFGTHPLERFDQAAYLHLVAGPDTLAYYFLNASNRASPEEHEVARIDGADTSWAVWRINPALETFGSSQTGFHFAFQGRLAALGRFTCRSRPGLDLALRTTAQADPTLAKGQVQGSCRIVASDIPPSDSTLAITGEFRSKRRNTTVVSPLWRLP